MDSLIKHSYLLQNVESNQKIRIMKITSPKLQTSIKSKIGGYGDTSHQRSVLSEELVSLVDLKNREFSSSSPLGAYLIKNDQQLKIGDNFQLTSQNGNKTIYRVLEKDKIIQSK